MAKTKADATAADAPTAATPPQQEVVPVRVTDRGDGWVLPSGERLSGGQIVDVDRPIARHLIDGGFAEWTTKIKATGPDVVTARAVLGKGQTANVDPSEAERLVRLGVAEVVKEDA
jgi:hypothetical protein